MTASGEWKVTEHQVFLFHSHKNQAKEAVHYISPTVSLPVFDIAHMIYELGPGFDLALFINLTVLTYFSATYKI